MIAAHTGHRRDKIPLTSNDPWTVFLVDDDPDDLELGKRVLEASPCIRDIVCLKDGEELFAELRGRHFFYDAPGNPPNSMIMLDIHMPHVNGIMLLHQLRTNPYTEKIPVMILTGDPSTAHVEKTYSLHANGFIAKPLRIEHLDHIHTVIANGKDWSNTEN